jgi:nucleotide-binding universal stress UspA family protein
VTSSSHRDTTAADWADPARAVVVGVDGSKPNEAAVAYAVHEADATGRPLTVLAVLDEFTIPIPRHSIVPDDERQWLVLNRIAEQVGHQHPDLTVSREVLFGGTVTTLLDRSVEQGMLVVGKRGLGTFGRLMVGSTSVGVAGRSRVPVVVVPDAWSQADHAGEPVVVGVNPEESHEATLRYAFPAAQRSGAELCVVYAIDIAPLLVWDPTLGSPAYWQEKGAEGLEKALKPFRDEFPDVAVTVREVRGHPATALLDEAEHAQLLVLGRHHAGKLGFSLGSAARSVLHYAELPVAVVPAT